MDLTKIEIPEELVVELPEDYREELTIRFTPVDDDSLAIEESECALCADFREVISKSDFLCTNCPFEKFADPSNRMKRGCGVWLEKIMRILGYDKFYGKLFVEQIIWDQCFNRIVREQMAKLRELVLEHGKAIKWF